MHRIIAMLAVTTLLLGVGVTRRRKSMHLVGTTRALGHRVDDNTRSYGRGDPETRRSRSPYCGSWANLKSPLSRSY